MNVRLLINKIRAEGVVLTYNQPDQLQITGQPAVVEKWTPELRLHKREIIAELIPLPAELEQRYRAMCARWRYQPDEVQESLNAARLDPAKAWLAVLADERRENEARTRWLGDA